MKLYFNGCSLTAGDELSAPQTEAWPALVADSLSATFLNDAALGGANDRIIYKTVPNVNNYDYFLLPGHFILDSQNIIL